MAGWELKPLPDKELQSTKYGFLTIMGFIGWQEKSHENNTMNATKKEEKDQGQSSLAEETNWKGRSYFAQLLAIKIFPGSRQLF